VALVALALIPLVGASLLAVGTTTGALRDKIGTYSRQLVDQIARNLEGEFQKIKGLTDDILIAPETSGRMVGYKMAGRADRIMTRFLFAKMLQGKFLNVDDVDDVIMLFSPQGPGFPSDLIHATDQYSWPISTLDQLALTVGSTKEVRNLGLTLTTLPDGSRTDVVLVRPLRNAMADETLGYLMVVLNPDVFSRVFRSVDVGAGSDLFVVDRSGTVVAGRHPGRATGTRALPAAWISPASPLSLRVWEGQEHLFSLAPLGVTGWTVVGAVPASYLNSESGKIATQVFLFSLVVLLVALLVSFGVAEGFTAPLRNLEKTMERFGEGAMEVRSDVGRYDEVGRLQRSFNTMAADITGLMARIDEEHRHRRLSELQVLEYQINPHFLYNTLDSINWMALQAHQPQISQIVTALARFFRLSLSQGRESHRVRDEIDHAKAYLSISQMRYPGCFEFEFAVDESLLDRRTLKIVLQPLLENAIKHGMDKRSNRGRLTIRTQTVDGGFEWLVVDNGKGISAEKRELLTQRLALAEDEGPGGFGLVNVHHRIRLNYGEGYGLALEETPGGGTTVRIRLAWEAEGDFASTFSP
jgi:two-component system sensor histidine kinase YesM